MKQCIARTKSFDRCKNAVEHGHILFCRKHRWWWLIALGTLLISGTTLLANWTTITGKPLITTVTLTPSQTITPSPSLTPAPSATSRPVSDYLHYMIVVDASSIMAKSFHGVRTWDVALNTINQIMGKLNIDSHFGLVVIGGSGSPETSDPCSEPASSLVSMADNNRNNIWDQISQFEPQRGGSFDIAFNTAKDELQKLPPDAVKMLIFVTGLNDTCNDTDEWLEIERGVSLMRGIDLYSQIIILDENGSRSQSVADRINDLLPEQVNVQAPQSLTEIQSNGVTLLQIVNNITTYENNMLASMPTDAPMIMATPTITSTPTLTATLKPGETRTVLPTSTFTNTPTFTPTLTKTLTPSLVPPPAPVCPLPQSPYLNTASFGGSAWINSPVDCTLDITSGEATLASGGYADLPPDAIVWVFVYPPNGPFYPQSPNAGASSPSPYPSQGGGGWNVPVYFGNLGDPSKTFDLIVMVTDQAGSDYIGQKLYEDYSAGFYDGISAGELEGLNVTTKYTITVRTK